jgi:uncharacterized cupredoxin-like copper-binding protein
MASSAAMKRYFLTLAAVLAGLAVVGCSQGKAEEDAQTISIRFSRFIPGELTAPAGKPMSFALKNGDPIEHEWIVGTEDVHERHRTGTEAYHDSRATEVTIPAFSTRLTTITFDTPGDYLFICHLPGHEAYGMRGIVHVVQS